MSDKAGIPAVTNKDEDKFQQDYDIAHEGTQIILPAEPVPMSTQLAITTLERKLADEQTILDVHEVINHHPYDALVAFNEVMRQTYGWTSPVPKMTFFGPQPPDLVTVKTGPKEGDSVQVPCGTFKLPNVEKPIEVYMNFAGNCLIIRGQVRKIDRSFLMELAKKTREYLKLHSIYRSKAINLKCDDAGNIVPSEISFIDTDYINPDELILNPDEYEQVTASLWTPIRQTALCETHGIPLKRGVLLEGVFGTGKTMTANVTSKICVDNGWTYILLDDVRGLKDAILFAQKYQPCVVFAEDVDRVAEERDQRGNDLLNTIDGILNKNSKVISVMTTNHVEKLNPAMLRPGRLDAVISVRPPEAEAVRRLVHLYGAELIDVSDDLKKSAEVLSGNIPATIREVVERSKLAMIAHGNTFVTDEDLFVAATGMEAHLNLLNQKTPDITDEEALGKAFAKVVGGNSEKLDMAMEHAAYVAHKVGKSASQVVKAAGSMEHSVAEGSKMVAAEVQAVKEDTEEILSEVS